MTTALSFSEFNTLFGIWSSLQSGQIFASDAASQAVFAVSQACGEISRDDRPDRWLARLAGAPIPQTVSNPLLTGALTRASVDALQAFSDFQTGRQPSLDIISSRHTRQQVRDLIEAEAYRRLKLKIRTNQLPDDHPLDREIRSLDGADKRLFQALWAPFPDEESGRETIETAYQILFRGRPVTLLPRVTEARAHVESHMDHVIQASQALFPDDWSLFTAEGKRNFISGERKRAEKKSSKEEDYRFARSLIHARAGRPLFEPPSVGEQRSLLHFVRDGLGAAAANFVSALSVFRDEMTAYSPSFETAFSATSPVDRFRLIELFFGPFHHRSVQDPEAALRLVRFLGELGFYRELAFSVYQNDEGATLTLGPIDGVIPEEENDRVVLHTHPDLYFLQEQVDADEIHADQVLLPSDTDVRIFSQEAVRLLQLHRQGVSVPRALLDPEARLFKNWVQSPYTASRLEVELAPEGVLAGIRIVYAIRPGYEEDPLVRQVLDPQGLEWISAMRERYFHVPYRFSREDYRTLVGGMPGQSGGI